MRAICEASGWKCYADELVRQWDGAMVLPQFCDKRNPQDFVTGVKERVPSWSRPEVADDFLALPLTNRALIDALTSKSGAVLTGA
jgi:hypothetical protein